MQNTQKSNTEPSNAPIECKCSSGCIATFHVVVVAHKEVVVSEADMCSVSADQLGRTLRLLPGLSWSATKITTRAIPMPQAQPDDKTRPVVAVMDQADSLTAPMSINDLINGVEAVRLSSCADPIVEAVDEETSGVIDTGLPAPLPLQDDPTTNAVADRPLPSLAHRIYVLKRLVEAFDDDAGFHSGDVSVDRKVSFDEDLAKHGARHQTMTLPVGASTFAGKMLNASVTTMKGSVTFHVFRFEAFAPWLSKIAADDFRALAPNLDQLDEKYHSGAFKFLRLVASEVAKRFAEHDGHSAPILKTAYFEFV